jgi:putative membrane protein
VLAWVRTAVTVMAFGFVVAKFGIIVDELPGHRHGLGLHIAAAIGTALVITGAVFLVMSTLEFLAVRRAIDEGTVHFSPALFVALSGLLVAVAIVLAVYLLITG